MSEKSDCPRRVLDDVELERQVACLSSPDESERRAAVSYLYKRFFLLALAIARRLGADPDVAQDIVQESFCNMCRYYRNRSIRSFPHYLSATVRHAWWRHQSRQQRFLPIGPEAEWIPLPGQSVVERMIEEERLEVVCSALKALTPEARAMIQMRFLEGKTLREIAKVLNVAPNTVKSRLEEALCLMAQRRAVEFKGDRK